MNLPAPLGILAGSGAYPELLAEAILEHQDQVVVAGLLGQANPDDFNHPGVRFRPVYLGAFKSAARCFLSAGVSHIFFAGGVNRQRAWRYLRPDLIGLALLANAMLCGDDAFLKQVAKTFSRLGIHVIDPAPFVLPLLASEGTMAGPEPTPELLHDLRIARQHAKAIGADDIGQGVLVRRSRLLAREDRRGTDALIRHAVPGSVLVKVVKPNQDRRFDLPAIGPDTALRCAHFGVRAIGVEAGGVLLLHRERIVRQCRRSRISLVGL